MNYIEEKNSLRQFCICIGDAKSRVLQDSTRAVFIVGSVEIVVVQCLICLYFCLGFWHERLQGTH